MLTQELLTFGKYKGFTVESVLKDRKYCEWLVKQEWFEKNYEFLYNRVKEYKPLEYFIKDYEKSEFFLSNYTFFNLKKVEDVQLPLTETEKTCYSYYLSMIKRIYNSVLRRLENEADNPYDIKAPTKWLQLFEALHKISRKEFKTFLASYELPNIPYIIERVKKEGGIEYKGAKSFIIAKDRSLKQEGWWEEILKSKYGEDLGTQFKYSNCIFDFLNISTNTIFECKLGLKDFSGEQHKKYKLALKEYRIIYLIGYDCVIEMEKKRIYTTSPEKYEIYVSGICDMKTPSYLDKLIEDFDIVHITDISTLFGVN